jgi:transposase-like protein
MRYPASEKLEIIRLVEQSHLPVKRTLEKLSIPRSTFYRWCDLYQAGGPEALNDCSPRPDRVWNRIPDDVRERIRKLALEEPALSPRELAVRFTDTESYFVSEAPAEGARSDRQSRLHRDEGSGGVLRKDHGTQPALADRLHIIGWGWERVGFEPTVRLPVQRFSSSKILMLARAAQ